MRWDIRRHRFGVNYTPTKDWFYFWNSLDAGSVARDLDGIRSLGADHIRLFLVWPFFQPDRLWVSPAHLERLDTVMRFAGEREIDVQLCMINGWLSGFRMIPHYDDASHPDNFYKSNAMLEAQELYFKEVAKVAAKHKNFMGFDIANEIPCAWSTGPDTPTGDAWCERMLTLCEGLFPDRIHVNGAWGQWFSPDTFSPRFMATRIKFPVIHCYPPFCGAPGKLSDPPSIRLGASTAALIRSYAGDPHKPVWCQEYGATVGWMPSEEIPGYLTKTTLAAIEGGVSWLTWWCSHDVSRKFELAEIEYGFGLMTNDGKLKPQGLAFKEIAEAYRGKSVSFKAMDAAPLPPPPAHPGDTWKWLLDWTARGE